MTTDPYDAVSALGPYFAVQRSGGSSAWRPLTDLLGTGLEDDPLGGRVAFTRSFLERLADAEVEERVAASTVSLGLFARLLSPLLGAAVLGAALPPLRPESTWWQPFETGPWPLAVDAGEPPAEPIDLTLAETIGPLVERFATGFALSRTILWGNAVSALFGAVAALRGTRPDLTGAAVDLAMSALGREPLLGTGDMAGGRFVRRSCCLYYRVPGGGYCGDCVLVPR